MRSWPRRSTLPSTTAFGSRIKRITAIIETVFPDPDSPTMPTTSPTEIESDSRSTARTSPFSVRNETLRSRTSSKGSGTTYPWIEQGVHDIDHGVCEDHEEGCVDHGRQDDRQVEVLKGVEGQLSDSVQAEHDLGQQRATAHERAEVEPEEADERDQRRPPRVPDHDAPLREPLRTRGAHIVLLLRLDERRAQHARVDPDVQDRQREPGEDQGLEPAERGLGEGWVAERRHPRKEERMMKAALGHQVDDLAEPEDRHGDPDEPD